MNADLNELGEFEEARLSRALKSEFDALSYTGRAPKKPGRAPVLIAAAAAVAAVAVGVGTLGIGGATPTWAATPHAVNSTTQDAAINACRDFANKQNGKIVVHNFSLGAFDARGTSTLVALKAIVTPADANATVPAGAEVSMACISVPGSDGKLTTSLAGGISLTPSASDDSVTGMSSPSGTWFVGWGALASGATSVELRADGLATTTATINDGHYALWWPKAVNGSIVELAADGTVLKTIPVQTAPPTKP